MSQDRTAFGKYQVIARLGQGGMGHVYLAIHAGPAGVQKLMVVKQLRDDLAESIAARSMFLDEARISTRLNHPNIVQTLEVVDERDDLYLVMEFLDGQPMQRLLETKHGGAFPLAVKLRILVEALEGLHYAHELTDYDGTPLNVIHRDVSPQNIMVTYDGHVKIVDFGVAKAADATSVTASGVFKGKVRYSAPEQALCLTVDRRADIFAVGTILWEILGGRRMWKDQADASVLLALASGKIPSLNETRPDAPPELTAICTKALSAEPALRYATAMEFRDALVAYLRHERDETNLAAALSAEFAAERRRLHGVIDQQVKALRETSAGALTLRNIPVIAPESNSGAHSADKSSARSSGLAVEPPSRRAGQLAQGRSASFIAAGAVAAIAAVVGGVAFLAPRGESASSGAATPASAPGHKVVHLSLHASPANARLVLDGTSLTGNPYEADVPRDESTHHVAIYADGYQSRDVEARFTRDVSLDVALAPTPAPPPQPEPVAPPPQPAPRTATRMVAPVNRSAPPSTPQRKIDEEDPYKR